MYRVYNLMKCFRFYQRIKKPRKYLVKLLWCIIIHIQFQIGTVPFALELGPSSPHKEYLPSSDNCVEMSGGNVLKTKGNFHMGTQTHCLYVCANVHFMKLSGLFFCWHPGREGKTLEI